MIGQMPEPTLWRLTIRPFFTRRFLSRIKEKGQRPFHSSHIIPQQRVGTEIMALFGEQKFGVFLFLIGDNFYSPDPIRKPPFLRGWRAKIRPKNWCKMRSKHLLTRAYHRTGKPSRKIRAIVTLQPPIQRVKVSFHLQVAKTAYRAAESLAEAFLTRIPNACFITFSWYQNHNQIVKFWIWAIPIAHSDLWYSSLWPILKYTS